MPRKTLDRATVTKHRPTRNLRITLGPLLLERLRQLLVGVFDLELENTLSLTAEPSLIITSRCMVTFSLFFFASLFFFLILKASLANDL